MYVTALFYRKVPPSEIKVMGYRELWYWYRKHELIVQGEIEAAEKLKPKGKK